MSGAANVPQKPQAPISPGKLLLFSSLPLFCFLLLAEVGLRVAGWKPLALAPQAYLWQADRRLGWRNRPGVRFWNRKLKNPVEVTTDADGFRNGIGWTSEGDSPIVLFVGDSTTFCAEVGDQETITSEIARRLGRDLDVRVLNAGVRGYSTVQASLMLEDVLKKFPTVVAVVYLFTLNDASENLNPHSYGPPAISPVVAIQPRGAPSIEGPSNPPVPHGVAFMDQIRFWKRVRIRLRSASALVQLVVSRVGRLLKPKSESLRTNRASEGDSRETDRAMEFALGRMSRIAMEHGAEFLTMGFENGSTEEPSPGYSIDGDYADLCKKLEVRFVSLAEHFKGPTKEYLAQNQDGSWDPHYGRAGTIRFAEAVAPVLEEIVVRRMSNESSPLGGEKRKTTAEGASP